uniref:ATP synthase F0 subunit 8 n=1 Tax=Pseudoniphargus triasi TaxID=2211536 RepID=A0A345UED5_9CRUS|nr:ATP synthase F0 subunit 8 [Pseudoniphargus triasi]
MPQMAPIMWLFLACLFLFLIYFLVSYLFFMPSPGLFSKTLLPTSLTKLHWKW